MHHWWVFPRRAELALSKSSWPLITALLLSAMLAGCGGGGGSTAVVTPPPGGGATLATVVEVAQESAVTARAASAIFGMPSGLRATLGPVEFSPTGVQGTVAGATFTGGSATLQLPASTTAATVTVRLGSGASASATVRLAGVKGQRLRLYVAQEPGLDLNQNGRNNDLLLRAISLTDEGGDGVADSLFLFERLYNGAQNHRSELGVRFVDLNGDGVLNTAQGELLMGDQDNDGVADENDFDDDNDGAPDVDDTDDDNDGIADGSDTRDTDNDNDGVFNFADAGFADSLIPATGAVSMAQVVQLVQDQFYFRNQLPPNLLAFTNAHQLAASLGDVFSAYLTPPDLLAHTQGLAGQFTGVGVVLQTSPGGGVRVKSVLAGGPAATAGVQVGDVILGVGGMDTSRATPGEAAGLLKGAAATGVLATLDRNGQRLNVVMQRAALVINPVSSVMEQGNVLRVVLTGFDSGSASLVKTAITQEAGLRGVILDLRGNPGGLVDEAVALADYFLSSGTIVTLAPYNGASQVSTASNQTGDITLPLVILQDAGSASASEIFAAAIKENNRGSVVGQVSYGKGIVQYIYNLTGGDGLKITAAGYLTPLGNDIHGAGVTPTHPVSQGVDPLPTALGLVP